MPEDVVASQKSNIKYIWAEDLYVPFTAFVNDWLRSGRVIPFLASECRSPLLTTLRGRRHKALMARLRGPPINCVWQVTVRHVSLRLVLFSLSYFADF